MSNNPPPPTSLADLCTVTYDRAASTRDHAVYRARSDRHVAVLYRVVLDDAAQSWTCDCPAGRHPDCKHRARCRLLHEARRWESHLDGLAPAQLRDLIPGKAAQARVGPDEESARACLIAVEALLLAVGEDDAIAA